MTDAISFTLKFPFNSASCELISFHHLRML